MLIDNTDKVPVSEALKLKKMFWLELTVTVTVINVETEMR